MWRLAWGRVPCWPPGRPFDLRLVAASLDSQYLALLQSFGHFAAGSCAHRRIAFSFRCIHSCLGVRPAFVQWRLPARVQHCWLQFCAANYDLPCLCTATMVVCLIRFAFVMVAVLRLGMSSMFCSSAAPPSAMFACGIRIDCVFLPRIWSGLLLSTGFVPWPTLFLTRCRFSQGLKAFGWNGTLM